MGDISMPEDTTYEHTPFGKEMLKHFLFSPTFKNLNHGSYGSFPRYLRDKQRELHDLCESAPDPFIRYTSPKLLDESRAVVAKNLNVPVETVVYVVNATTGVNTVLRNIEWHEDGKDEILYFNTIYEACGRTVAYVCEASGYRVHGRAIDLTYPMEDADVVAVFKEAIKASRAARKFPRVAIFDTISSLPGVRVPFEMLTAACREEGVLSLIDGAHGIGQIHLDLGSLDPDFFVTNCHKWLFVPRGCAVFYVPVRNQSMMRSSLPTSHGFVPRGNAITGTGSSLPVPINGDFVNQFEFVGTTDQTSFFVVPEALKWREQVCGGEDAIINYTTNLAHQGGKLVADMLGTYVMDNSTNTLTQCAMVNIALPIKASAQKIPGMKTVKPENGWPVARYMHKAMADDKKTFIAMFYFQETWWARLSAQVYLDLSDFQFAGQMLKEICKRVVADGSFS